MAAPNIDVIAASLRSCSLSDAVEAAKLRPSSGTPAIKVASGDAAAADIVLDLNSDLALPCHWEQLLDLKTGMLYYINRSTGERTKEDPRKFAGSCGDDVDSGEDEEVDDGDDADADDEDEPDDEDEYSSEGEATAAQSDDSSIDMICSSTVSSSSSGEEEDAVERGAPAPVLVAAGCRACLMFVMIPKGAEECPRCRGHVICFGRSRSR